MNRTGREKSVTPSFVLTLKEKKIICFVLFAFLLGLLARQYREDQPPPKVPTIKATADAKRSALQNKKSRDKEPASKKKSRQ